MATSCHWSFAPPDFWHRRLHRPGKALRRRHDHVDHDRTREPLQVPLAERLQLEPGPMAKLPPDVLAGFDPAGLGLDLDSGRRVDPVSIEIPIGGRHDVAEVHADPQLGGLALGG